MYAWSFCVCMCVLVCLCDCLCVCVFFFIEKGNHFLTFTVFLILPLHGVEKLAAGDGGPVPPNPSLTAATFIRYSVSGCKSLTVVEVCAGLTFLTSSQLSSCEFMSTKMEYATIGGSPSSHFGFQGAHWICTV